MWDKTSFMIRKTAHFSIYTLLGFCASFAVGKRKLFTLKSLGVILFGFTYAASDEFHQKFVKGRSCEFRDMMIDTGGVTTGMLISLIVMGIIALILRKRSRVSSK
jgi:VanZ family protein